MMAMKLFLLVPPLLALAACNNTATEQKPTPKISSKAKQSAEPIAQADGPVLGTPMAERGKIYDVAYLQFFQADQVRGLFALAKLCCVCVRVSVQHHGKICQIRAHLCSYWYLNVRRAQIMQNGGAVVFRVGCLRKIRRQMWCSIPFTMSGSKNAK